MRSHLRRPRYCLKTKTVLSASSARVFPWILLSMSSTRGKPQKKFRVFSHLFHSAVFTEPLLSTWNTRPPLRSIFVTESKKPESCGVNLRAVLKSQHCVQVSATVGRGVHPPQNAF